LTPLRFVAPRIVVEKPIGRLRTRDHRCPFEV
jgi:hypothetical protein